MINKYLKNYKIVKLEIEILESTHFENWYILKIIKL